MDPGHVTSSSTWRPGIKTDYTNTQALWRKIMFQMWDIGASVNMWLMLLIVCVCVCHCILSNCVCAWMQKRKCVLGETLTVPEPRGNLKVNQLWETVMRAGWQSWNVRLVFIIKVIYCRLAEMLLHASFNSMSKCLEIGKISSNLNHTTIWCWMVNPIWIANDCSSINDHLRLAAEVSQFQ